MQYVVRLVHSGKYAVISLNTGLIQSAWAEYAYAKRVAGDLNKRYRYV